MARQYEKLKALTLPRLRKPGMYSDGGGLYFRIGPSGAKSWILRYMRKGKSHDMGLGPFHIVSLKDARLAASENRLLLYQNVDPLLHRRQCKTEELLEDAKLLSFEDCAEEYLENQQAAWKSFKHAKQWRSTLKTYVYPVFGNLPIQQIATNHILEVLQKDKFWVTKSETASRVRGRIEAILDSAKVRGLREGENPARWKGHLDKLLPPKSRIKPVRHHPALPYAELPEFISNLNQRDGFAAKALYFTILTAARTDEVLGATWKEIESNVWVVPAHRMKAGIEHRVPLVNEAHSLLNELPKLSEYLFPGQQINKPLSNMAMLTLLKRMNCQDITVHGFRSTFRTWVSEQTNFLREVAESALAHKNDNKVEAAYQRGDLLAKKAELLEKWAIFCTSPSL